MLHTFQIQNYYLFLAEQGKKLKYDVFRSTVT